VPPPLVAHVNLARGFRGGERQTELLLRELAALGWPQRLVAHRDGELVRRAAGIRGVEAHAVAGNLLAATLATAGAGLVHVHEGRGVYAAWLRNRVSGTPYVITRRVNNPLGNAWWTHDAYRRAGVVAGVARDVTRIVGAWDPAVRTAVVHSATSAQAVDATEAARLRSLHRGKFVVGHVGALDNAQKGQEYIIAVARELADTHPDIHFVLVGGGADGPMLERLACGLPNLSFAGFVDNVADHMASFDVFILPSNREGIGAVLLDAMSVGLPVVASRVAGLPEIVHDGENGLLIEPRRPDQLRDAILRLHRDPALRQRLSEAGRRFAAGFTPAAMARHYVGLYQSLPGIAQA
jgi:glycosyltransferase involved in cell wall biosynthesis